MFQKITHFKGSVSANVFLHFCQVKRVHILIWMNNEQSAYKSVIFSINSAMLFSMFAILYAVEAWTNEQQTYFRTGDRRPNDNNNS